MKILNLFAGPGVGKSTTASGIFYEMKRKGINVELVSEYAKDMTWEERGNILDDQVYILAKQHRRISRLVGKVDWVVTDSPFLLGLLYTNENYYKTFKPLVHEMWNSYDNFNVLLERSEIIPYQEIGRNQNLEQAKIIDKSLKYFMEETFKNDYNIVESNNSVETILNLINV